MKTKTTYRNVSHTILLVQDLVAPKIFISYRWFHISKYSVYSSLGPMGTFRSFKICSDAEERVGCGKQQEATAPIHP